MKTTITCILCILISTPCVAEVPEGLSSNQALDLMFRASEIIDYSQYAEFSKILGFRFSNPRSWLIDNAGVKKFDKLGNAKDFDVTATNETVISAASRNPDYKIYFSQAEDITRVHFSFLLDTQSLCIHKEEFSRTFAPTQFVPHGHSLSGHLEKEIEGKHKRFVIAYFDTKSCASTIKFYQSN
jgi:hypothetical protein